MKALAVIVNVFLPGVGTLIVGKIGSGIFQIILYLVGLTVSLTGVGVIVGLPIMLAVWIWAIVSAATANPEPVRVVVTHRDDRVDQT